jgi:FixJ family two-component response regulator
MENDLAEAPTILIAVGDGVLADSLRFSLELEGYAVKLCDEYSLPRTIGVGEPRTCLVLDQDVFARMADRRFDALGVPVILMTEGQNGRLLARAEAAGVTKVVETPLLGAALFDAIKAAIEQTPVVRRRHRAS